VSIEQPPFKHLQYKAEARVLNLPPFAFRRGRHPRRLRYPRQYFSHYFGIGAPAPSAPRASASAPRFRIDIKHMVVTALLVQHPFEHPRHPRHHRHHRHPRHYRRLPTCAFRHCQHPRRLRYPRRDQPLHHFTPATALESSPRHLCTAVVSCLVSITYYYHGALAPLLRLCSAPPPRTLCPSPLRTFHTLQDHRRREQQREQHPPPLGGVGSKEQ